MSSPSPGLSALFQRVLSEYPESEIGEPLESHQTREDVEDLIPATVREILADQNLHVRGSVGQGRWTSIPWVAIMDPMETTDTHEGIYVVYLFEPQEGRVRLSLNQGVTSLKNDLGTAAAREQLQAEARQIRAEVEVPDFAPGPIEFPHASARNELYGAGTIFYREYNEGEIPPDETLEEDLRTLLDAYQEVLTVAKPPTVYQVPIQRDDGPIRRNYERTVLDGVASETITEFCDVPLDTDQLRLWGNQAETPAREGDVLLFATRDGRRDGAYTHLARVAYATVLNPPAAERVTEAVGWGAETDRVFPHLMVLQPIWEADLDREEFWDLLGFQGWPKDTYSAIDFERDGSSFASEYDSVEAFLADIEGERIYPVPDADSYDGISEATEDVSARLTHTTIDDLLGSQILHETIREWTTVLRRSNLVENEITRSDLQVVRTIADLYRTNEERFADRAEELGVGTLGGLSPGQVLFVVLLRLLQDAAGERPNFNHVKMIQLLNGAILEGGTSLQTRDDPPARGETIARQLGQVKNLVFHGPPGTGKTYTAQQFARWWLAEQCEAPTEDQLEVVTFHPSFTYEDFLEGLTAKARDGSVEYTVASGVFKRLCRRASEAYEAHQERDATGRAPPYVLVIDEINRGNLAQIFGEVITLLETDKRLDAANETTTTLPHSGDRFVVPPNLYVIGTMNTADRSIALVDAALRRRFRFLHFPPEMEVLHREYDFAGTGELRRVATSLDRPGDGLLALSILALEELNERIRSAPQLGRGKQLGHSYLLGIDRSASATEQMRALVDTWQYEILPLLEEYYFSQFEEIERVLFDGDAGPLLNAQTQEIGNFTGEELVHVLADLVNEANTAQWSPPAAETTTTDDTTYTINYLFDEGLLTVGDELTFVREKLPDGVNVQFDPGADYWRCTVTGNDDRRDGVRWTHDGELYSISELTRHIYRDLTDDAERGMSGTEWWRLPKYDQYTLSELRNELQQGRLSVGSEEVVGED